MTFKNLKGEDTVLAREHLGKLIVLPEFTHNYNTDLLKKIKDRNDRAKFLAESSLYEISRHMVSGDVLWEFIINNDLSRCSGYVLMRGDIVVRIKIMDRS